MFNVLVVPLLNLLSRFEIVCLILVIIYYFISLNLTLILVPPKCQVVMRNSGCSFNRSRLLLIFQSFLVFNYPLSLHNLLLNFLSIDLLLNLVHLLVEKMGDLFPQSLVLGPILSLLVLPRSQVLNQRQLSLQLDFEQTNLILAPFDLYRMQHLVVFVFVSFLLKLINHHREPLLLFVVIGLIMPRDLKELIGHDLVVLVDQVLLEGVILNHFYYLLLDDPVYILYDLYWFLDDPVNVLNNLNRLLHDLLDLSNMGLLSL